MIDALLTVLAGPRHIDFFGLDDYGQFDRLARASSWSEARAVLDLLPGHRRFTLVAAGSPPPPWLLHNLAPRVDRLVLVPEAWLAGLSRRRPGLRARRAARLAAAHIVDPIETVQVLPDDALPF